MILMIDNYDSFTYNLVRYVKELNYNIMVAKNDQISIDKIKQIKPEAIIISPGPKTPDDAKISNEVLKNFTGIIPILGICLGHQCIAKHFGAQVIKNDPIHGKVEEINHTETSIFKKIKTPLSVTRYHSLVVSDKNLPKNLEILATTKKNEIMAIKDKNSLTIGVQFHPEAHLSEMGHQLLENYLRSAKCKKQL